MFSSIVQSVNGDVNASAVEVVSSFDKRSKMCDADANGKVGSACKR